MMEYRDPIWSCQCDPRDGGRLTRLQWRGLDLLTGPDVNFRPGEGFESRPVYGYDDCFPSVAAQEDVPDHGLCWSMHPETSLEGDGLSCLFRFETGLRLHRRLHFQADRLVWAFRIDNPHEDDVHVQHVMHALMPPAVVRRIRAPLCEHCADSLHGETFTPDRARDPLSLCPEGSARMLLLQEVQTGEVMVELADRRRLRIGFDPVLFPTLGIWLDRGGYPAHAPRQELAIEPIPGPSGDLRQAVARGQALRVPGNGVLAWNIEWAFLN
jgi:hypothetical protein